MGQAEACPHREHSACALCRDRLQPVSLDSAAEELLQQYIDAFQRYDVDALVGLLRDDATLSMPPYTLWLQGPDVIRQWLLGPGSGCRGSRLIPVNVSGTRGFAQYRPSPDGIHRAWAVIILELAEGGITGWNSFLDVATHFPLLDLPLEKNFNADR